MGRSKEHHDFEEVAEARVKEARELLDDGDEEAAEELVVHVLRAFRRHGCVDARLDAVDLAAEIGESSPEPLPILFEVARHEDPVGAAARQALADLGLELSDDFEVEEDDEDEVLTEDFRRDLDREDADAFESDEGDEEEEDEEDYGGADDELYGDEDEEPEDDEDEGYGGYDDEDD